MTQTLIQSNRDSQIDNKIQRSLILYIQSNRERMGNKEANLMLLSLSYSMGGKRTI